MTCFIAGYLEKNQLLIASIQVLTWNSKDLTLYLAEAFELVRETNGMLTDIRTVVQQVQNVLKQWQSDATVARKEGKLYTFEELGSSTAHNTSMRQASITGVMPYNCQQCLNLILTTDTVRFVQTVVKILQNISLL